MSISDPLTIKLTEQIENKYVYECIGSIDAHAAKGLEDLKGIPAGVEVVLDFSRIERVNSMGLSLLLKIFEEWESNKTKVEVCHLNRMVNMLFKITGLGRFTAEGSSKVSGPKSQKMINSSTSLKAKSEVIEEPVQRKLNFVASLQTGQQLSGWYLFNTYLQRKLQRAIHFEQLHDVKNAAFHLFFAKPFDACAMIEKRNFLPIVRPVSEADEVVVLTRADDSRELKDFEPLKTTVITAEQASFVYLLGRFLCDETGLSSERFNYQFAGNEIKAIQMLIRKKADVAFLLKKTYEGLSSFSRKKIRLIDQSVTDFAFHQFCLAPNLVDQTEELVNILTMMDKDEKGSQILQDIQFDSWMVPDQAEIEMLKSVYKRYVRD